MYTSVHIVLSKYNKLILWTIIYMLYRTVLNVYKLFIAFHFSHKGAFMEMNIWCATNKLQCISFQGVTQVDNDQPDIY